MENIISDDRPAGLEPVPAPRPYNERYSDRDTIEPNLELAPLPRNEQYYSDLEVPFGFEPEHLQQKDYQTKQDVFMDPQIQKGGWGRSALRRRLKRNRVIVPLVLGFVVIIIMVILLINLSGDTPFVPVDRTSIFGRIGIPKDSAIAAIPAFRSQAARIFFQDDTGGIILSSLNRLMKSEEIVPIIHQPKNNTPLAALTWGGGGKEVFFAFHLGTYSVYVYLMDLNNSFDSYTLVPITKLK